MGYSLYYVEVCFFCYEFLKTFYHIVMLNSGGGVFCTHVYMCIGMMYLCIVYVHVCVCGGYK